MLDFGKILMDGGIISILISFILIGMLWYNPRMFLNKGDYPPDVIAAVPPKTDEERWMSIILGIPFFIVALGVPLSSTSTFNRQMGSEASFWLLFWHTFGVIFIPFLWDLVVLDWWMFCTVTPKFVVIPGTEGFAGYKDKVFHLRMHTRGIVVLVIGSLLISGVVWFL